MLNNNWNFNKQRGLTFISWVVVLVFLGFVGLISLKMIPAYLEHYSIKSSLHSLAETPKISKYSKLKIKDLLLRRFQMNSIKRVMANDLVIEKQSREMTLTLDYEIRVKIIGNVDVVMHFIDEVVVQ